MLIIKDSDVTLIDHMGSDLSVVNAARVSFHKESDKFTEKDEKLINYLAKHKHWTPFAHSFVSFRVRAPIFVARQLAKHQVGLVWNEVSRRYVQEPPDFFFPEGWRGRPEGGAKQGSSTSFVDDGIHEGLFRTKSINEAYERLLDMSFDLYMDMIEHGVAPEMARIVLPQSTYTEWIWSGSLVAFTRVCKLRLDPHTQLETRIIAEKIYNECQELFPCSWKALMEVE